MTRRMLACLDKTPFPTKKDAEAALLRTPGLKVYKCLTAEHWHLAHRKARRAYARSVVVVQ